MNAAKLRQDMARFDAAGVHLCQEVLRIAGHMQIAETELPTKIQLSVEPASKIQWSGESERKIGSSPGNCLTAFIRLDTASDEQILHFVQKWGTLGIDVEECDYVYKCTMAAKIAEQLREFEILEQTCIEYNLLSLNHRVFSEGMTLAETITYLRSINYRIPSGMVREEKWKVIRNQQRFTESMPVSSIPFYA